MIGPRRLSLGLAVTFGVAGCAAAIPELPGDNASTYNELRTYYSRNAWEQRGECRAPYLDGILDSRMVEEDEDRLVLEVSYAYRDLIGTDDGSEILPSGGTDRCHGTEERTFVLARRGEEHYEVVEMSGRKRGEWGPTLFE